MRSEDHIRQYMRTSIGSSLVGLAMFLALFFYAGYAPRGHFAAFMAAWGAEEKFPGQADKFLVFLMVASLGLCLISAVCATSAGLHWWSSNKLREIKNERN